MAVSYPSARAFLATLNREGFEESSARGGSAVLMERMPSFMPSRQQSGPRPVVQCVCSSTGTPLALAKMIGTRVCMRSGVSSPPGSLRQRR